MLTLWNLITDNVWKIRSNEKSFLLVQVLPLIRKIIVTCSMHQGALMEWVYLSSVTKMCTDRESHSSNPSGCCFPTPQTLRDARYREKTTGEYRAGAFSPPAFWELGRTWGVTLPFCQQDQSSSLKVPHLILLSPGNEQRFSMQSF